MTTAIVLALLGWAAAGVVFWMLREQIRVLNDELASVQRIGQLGWDEAARAQAAYKKLKEQSDDERERYEALVAEVEKQARANRADVETLERELGPASSAAIDSVRRRFERLFPR